MLNSLKTQMQNTPSFARNIAWMAWSGTISIANSVIVWMVMARSREAAEMGRFTLVMSLYLLFFTICSLGLNPYLVAEISRQGASTNGHSPRQFLTNAMLILLFWSLLCVGAMNVSGVIISSVNEVRAGVLVMSLTMPMTAMMTIADSYCTAFGRVRFIAAAATTENVLRTVLPIYLLLRGNGLVAICGSFVLARLIAIAVYAIALRLELAKFLRHRIEVQAAEWKRLIRVVPTFAGITILASIHLQLAVILLGRLGTEEAAAQYGVASRFLIPFAILMSSYAAVLQPEAARKAQQSTQLLAAFLARSLRFVMPAAALVALTGAFFARPILTLLFGTRYTDATVTLGVLLASIVPFCGVMILARGLIALQKQHLDLLGNVIAVATSLVLGMILIPKYGAIGAAVAHLLSMLALFAVELLSLWHHLLRPEPWPLPQKSHS